MNYYYKDSFGGKGNPYKPWSSTLPVVGDHVDPNSFDNGDLLCNYQFRLHCG